MAAGALIVFEAGGHVSDFNNGEFLFSGEETVATNGHIHKEMIGILNRKNAGGGKKEQLQKGLDR